MFLKSALSELDPTTAMLEKEHEEVSFFILNIHLINFNFFKLTKVK